jgi:hypothetical protein
MRFAKKQNIRIPLSLLLTLLMLIQPFGFSFAMTDSSAPAHHTPAHHIAAVAEHHHSEHTPADQMQNPENEDATMAGDCCATMVCCPAVTNTCAPKIPMASPVTQYEFRVSFQAITLPIEIKPPRHVLAS